MLHYIFYDATKDIINNLEIAKQKLYLNLNRGNKIYNFYFLSFEQYLEMLLYNQLFLKKFKNRKKKRILVF